MIETYTHSKHRSLVEGWLSSRGIMVPPPELSSSIGFVIGGQAIGFLYTTNSRIAYIDQVVTRPGLSKEEREDCLRVLILWLTRKAKEVGAGLVVACCGSENMQNRFYRQGFNKQGPYTLVHKGVS